MLTKQSNGKVLRTSLEKNGKDKDKAKIIRVQVRFIEVFGDYLRKLLFSLDESSMFKWNGSSPTKKSITMV
jgi:hypothetical protein